MTEFVLFTIAVAFAAYMMGRAERIDRAIIQAHDTAKVCEVKDTQIATLREWLAIAHKKQWAMTADMNRAGRRLGAARQKIARMHRELRRLTPPKA